jgi:hypothetical protein
MASSKRNMVVVEIAARTGKETPIAWASSDYWAMVTATELAAKTRNELYWRIGTPAEVKALQAKS